MSSNERQFMEVHGLAQQCHDGVAAAGRGVDRGVIFCASFLECASKIESEILLSGHVPLPDLLICPCPDDWHAWRTIGGHRQTLTLN